MAQQTLTERQQRERSYYDEYSALAWADTEVCFDPILGKEQRPHNSYWYLYGEVQKLFRDPSQRLLDFGCGCGSASIVYATIGYQTWGFDVSPGNIQIARALAEKHQVAERTHFEIKTAEDLDYPAESFDVIVGTDILHHVDIERAMARCVELLKPDGTAIFHEPVEAMLFDRIRNSRLGKRLVPNEASFDKHITQDERKLTRKDLRVIAAYFPKVRDNRFRIFTRLERILPQRLSSSFNIEKADMRILRLCPWLRPFAGTTVLVLKR